MSTPSKNSTIPPYWQKKLDEIPSPYREYAVEFVAKYLAERKDELDAQYGEGWKAKWAKELADDDSDFGMIFVGLSDVLPKDLDDSKHHTAVLAEVLIGIPAAPAAPSCEHEWVNVGFTSLKMACKHCGVDMPKERE
jgi:hypothetical protein